MNDSSEIEIKTNALSEDLMMERYGRQKGPDRAFVVEYWQWLGKSAVFQAARW